jgi:GTP-binding protein
MAKPRNRPARDENMRNAHFSLAVLGRPNVGKSTLFNRLVGKRVALVDNQPGVTRDLREGVARLGTLRFTVIDTAGLEDAKGDDLPARMRRLTERAIEEADVCLFVVDARAGVTPTDQIFADIIRKRAEHVILAANKAEGRAGAAGIAEAFGLGLGEVIPLSAEHGEGMEDLYRALVPIADAMTAQMERIAFAAANENENENEEQSGGDAGHALGDDADHQRSESKPIQFAVVGRPNAGKSTLVNQLLGEDRLLTGPEAGITRDAIGFELAWLGRKFKVFDTAGLRKKSKIHQKIEKLSVNDALRSVRFAEIVVILMDVNEAFENQDLRIADLAEKEGRAVVFAVNKWDIEQQKQRQLASLKQRAEQLLPQIKGAPLVAMSAITGAGLARLHAAIVQAHDAWNRRAPTAKLNQWLAEHVARHPPPAPGGRRIRLRYMTQAKTRPPTFALFATRASALPDSYIRFISNGLRESFNMPGTPIRIILKSSDNPYASKAKKQR